MERRHAPIARVLAILVLSAVGDVPVAIFPSDHYVGDDRAFIEYARKALDVVRILYDAVAVVGIEPSAPEIEYGWIQPAKCPLLIDEAIFQVGRFVEKPSAPVASELWCAGASEIAS